MVSMIIKKKYRHDPGHKHYLFVFKIPVLSGALEKHDGKVSTCGRNNAKLQFATHHEIQSNLS